MVVIRQADKIINDERLKVKRVLRITAQEADANSALAANLATAGNRLAAEEQRMILREAEIEQRRVAVTRRPR